MNVFNIVSFIIENIKFQENYGLEENGALYLENIDGEVNL